MESALPVFVTVLSLIGMAIIGLLGWALSNNVRMSRIVAALEVRMEDHGRRLDLVEQDLRK